MTQQEVAIDEPLIIPRYTGEDKTTLDHSVQVKKLLKSIEKRKLKKLQQCNAPAVTGTLTDPVKPSIKKGSPGTESAKIKDDPMPIIGGHSFEKNKKVVAVLPKWLSQPTIISTDLTNLQIKAKKFDILDKLLLRNLKNNGIKYLFPVQTEVIPWLLKKQYRENSLISLSSPRDLCVSAPTGSGKTLTYVLPIIQSLKNRFVPKIRALIVVPVQELALQVLEVFKRYAVGTKLRIEVTTGGNTELSVEQMKLIKTLKGINDDYESKIDILVTTPGRLVEHLNSTKGFDLSNLRYLVIDEADRVIENVQDDWMHVLDRHMNNGNTKCSSVVSVRTLKLRRQPQKLLFSATLSHDPEKLKQLGLFQPILFTSSRKPSGPDCSVEDYAGKYTTPQELVEYYTTVPLQIKPLIMWYLVMNQGWKKVLCFAKTIDEAHRLSKLLTLLLPGKTIKELSSKLSRKERESTLKDFASGNVDILVCSDLMARGVDIPNVEYVVSYDPPKHIEGYIHRIGRTGRAGSHGTALIILDPGYQRVAFLQKLQQANKTDVQEMDIPESDYISQMDTYKEALASLKLALEEETKNNNKNLKRKNTKKHSRNNKKMKKNTNG